MNIVFFGNTKYSTIVEKKLHQNFKLSAVVTIPDQPQGRKKIMTPSPVKSFAVENNISVIETKKLDLPFIEKIKSLNPDFLVVADYRFFLPQGLLDIPKFAPLNVHHSLLPKYRGPSPAPFAILAGEKISGVTIIKMVQEIDAGDIFAQNEYVLRPDETTDSLLTALNNLGADLIIPVINDFSTIKSKPQDTSTATFTHYFSKQDGFIDLNNPPSPEIFDRMVRAYFPWPNVWGQLETNNLKLKTKNKEFKIIKFLPEKKIQLEGKNPVDLETFYRGYPELREKIEKLYN